MIDRVRHEFTHAQRDRIDRRVARKHAGHQEGGWQFTMRQLYEKSGSTSRFSDFAIDVRKVIDERSNGHGA